VTGAQVPADTAAPAQPGRAEEPWQRLNPRMLAILPIHEIPRMAPALLALFAVGRGGHGSLWSLVGVVIVLGMSMIRWTTTRFRITAEQIQVQRGLLRRKMISVPRDRVRTVDVTAPLLHRLLGLVRVTVGTGQSDRSRDSGVRLDGLSAVHAATLREELLHRRGRSEAVTADRAAAPAAEIAAPEETELVAVAPGWIRYGPFTLSGVVTVAVVAGFLWRGINEAHLNPARFGPLRSIGAWLSHTPLPLVVAEAVLVIVIVVALASTGGYVLAFWRFRLTRHSGGTLHVTRGLLTTRATSIEERRLRGMEVSEPLLLRSVGGARCIAVATGLRVGRGAERGGSLLMPPGPRTEAQRVAGEVLGSSGPVTAALTPHGPRALRRRYTRALAIAALIVGALLLLWWGVRWPAWTWQVAVLLFPAGVLLASDRYRSLGHALRDGHLVTRQGSVIRRRVMLGFPGIIGFTMRQSFFQRRAGLVTLTATTAAGRQGYEVLDIPADEAVHLADQAVPGLLTPFLAPHRPTG
jgi:putative membrane protein